MAGQCVPVHCRAVDKRTKSGTAEELMADEAISREAIVGKVEAIPATEAI